MQVPVISGVYSSAGAPDVRISYPKNLVPTPVPSGISEGYLRPGDGIVQVGTVGAVTGVTRGGINWMGVLYRVIGSRLYSLSAAGVYSDLGNVGNGPPVSMAYGPSSPAYPMGILAIASGGGLFLFDGASVVQVTDPDLGFVADVIWVDGYFMTTDGEFLVVTELTDPTAVEPLKYGSSEADPDPVIALLKVRNEPVALNRYTIEMFDNVGGAGFPFQRIEGAQIMRGCVGAKACCIYEEAVAFIGSGRNEQPGIYIAGNGSSNKISTVEIDRVLAGFTEQELSLSVLEPRNDNGHSHLYVHLPDRTLVYDMAATQAVKAAVWFTLSTSLTGFGLYRARFFVWCYDRWNVGDPNSARIGYTDQTIGTHWGETVGWEFQTVFAYNASKGAIIHSLELVALSGRVALGDDPTISTSYSVDGVQWSQSKSISVGAIGERTQRLVWRRNGFMRNFRGQRFQGTSDAHLGIMRLEIEAEGLAV
jgi:hypothetical protein